MADADISQNKTPQSFFAQLPMRKKLMGLGGLAAAIALVVALALWSKEPEYSLLFANLDDKDGGAVVVALQQQNIPYKVSNNGASIMVPSHMTHDLRLKLATQGIPRGQSSGFEILEKQQFGVSQFTEQINFQRALEGELARSIQTLAAVTAARVHLAIPKQTGFLKDDQKPSASVIVSLKSGRTLDPDQIAGIVHLVAASVPKLSAKQVSVIDQNGTLLNRPKDSDNAGFQPDASQLKYQRGIEATYIQRIEEILTPMVGAGNVKAQVTAEIDFSQSEQHSESFKPNSPEQAAIRSQQTSEATNRNPLPAGVAGAASNQPPSLAAPLPGPLTGDANVSAGTSKNATINYELDKTIKVTRSTAGEIKRLAVAVLVNYANRKNEKGEVTPTALTDDQIKQVTNLVQEAVGFNKERGDTIAVANSPFVVPEKPIEPEIPIWQNPELIEAAKLGAKYLLVTIAVLYLIFGVIKPLVRQMMKPAPPPVVPARKGQQEDDSDSAQQKPKTYEDKLQEAKQLALKEPKLVANVIKDWVGNN